MNNITQKSIDDIWYRYAESLKSFLDYLESDHEIEEIEEEIEEETVKAQSEEMYIPTQQGTQRPNFWTQPSPKNNQ